PARPVPGDFRDPAAGFARCLAEVAAGPALDVDSASLLAPLDHPRSAWTASHPQIVGLAHSALRQQSPRPTVPLSPLTALPSCDPPSSRRLVVPLPLRLERRNNEARSTDHACLFLNGGKKSVA